MDSASEILARYFGYTSFRPGQEGLIKTSSPAGMCWG